jgi:4-amino-4-deoxy-L-arabinose transferase-like glycosyltransferase
MFKRLSPKIILILILLISFAVRMIGLTDIPPSLSWDEVSHGYNAYSILKTGHDEWGQTMPITNFRAYGDYPTTLYMYLLMPIISLFGLNDITVRLPSVIFGSLLSLVIYFLVKKTTQKEGVALITAFLVSISPWGVLLGRQALQATPAIFIMSLGVLVFLIGMEKRLWVSIIGSILLGLSAYGYHNTRIFAPLLLLSLLIIYRKKLFADLKVLVSIIIFSTILFTPIFFALTSAAGNARSNWVGILDQGAINNINESRGNSKLSPLLARLTHNKVTYFTKVAVKNYFGYFGPSFLATKGGTHYQFSIQGFGVINPIELPFFYLGLFLLLINIKKLNKISKLILFWLLVSPLPAVITRDPYQVVRATTMMPAVYLVIAFGLKGFSDIFAHINKVSYYKTVVMLALIFSYFSFKYFDNLIRIYPVKHSQSWQYGYKEAVLYAKENYSQYDKIIITKVYGEPHEFVYFYTLFNPAKLISEPNLVRYQKTDWYWTDSIDKYIFVNDWEIKDKSKNLHNTLVIAGPKSIPENGKVLKTINFLDGSPAFIIVSLP